MEIYSWGANSHGQLGQGIISEQCNTPQSVKLTWNVPIALISSGGAHSLLLDGEGQISGCGWNQQKQLGYENKSGEGIDQHTFAKIWDLSGISFRYLCTGWDSSAGVTDKHVLYLWGSNSYGQLGLPKEHFPKCVKPIQLELKTKFISMGMRHTILVDVNGCVWTTGSGKRGQLGHGNEVVSLDSFKKIPNVNNIEIAKCGQHHTFAWSKIENKMYSWGDNTYGQLGLRGVKQVSTPKEITMLNEFINQIVSINCGWTHTAILLKDGRAVYWGRNDYGQLGCDNTSNTNFNVISINGALIKELSVGSEHSVCVLEDASIWSWGWNEHGNTGTGEPHNVKKPQRVKVDLRDYKTIRLYSGAGNNFLIAT